MTEETTGIEFIDKEEFVKEVSERFRLTEKQASVVYHMGLGDAIVEAVQKVYSTKAGDTPGGNKRASSNAYHQTTKLMNMHKFQQALDYINNEDYIEMRLKRYRAFLLDFAHRKMKESSWNPNAQVGLWKGMMGLAFNEKLPDEGKKLGESMSKLAEHFLNMERSKKLPKPVEEEEGEGDVKH